MTERTTPEDRVAPILLTGAVAGLLFLAGCFVMALLRGPNPLYVYVSGTATVVFALGIGDVVRRRRAARRRRW